MVCSIKMAASSDQDDECRSSRRQISRVLLNQSDQAASQATRKVRVFQLNPHKDERHLGEQVLPGQQDTPPSSFEHQQQQRSRDTPAGFSTRADIDDGDLEERESLREVYLFDCCGKTRELKPAHEYLGTFRGLFHAVNTMVFLFGFACFGMGLWFRIDPKVYEIHKYIETQNFTIAGWIMLFGGFLACMIALIGWLGAIKSSISLLLWYFLIIMALNVSFVSVVIMLTIYGLGAELESFLVKELYEQIRRRTMNSETQLFLSNEATSFLDYVQVKMRCCGAADFRDYQKLGMVVPSTCYTILGNYVNAPGCGRAIRRLMDIRAGMGTGFSTGSVVCQLVASILCAMMICSIYSARAAPSRALPSGQNQLEFNRRPHES